jgi:hypothetical protein
MPGYISHGYTVLSYAMTLQHSLNLTLGSTEGGVERRASRQENLRIEQSE